MEYRIENPYLAEGEWYKGNFHNHSEIFSQKVCIDSLAEAGNRFAVMSEHDQNKPDCADCSRSILLIPGFEQSKGPNPHVVVANARHKQVAHLVTKGDYQNFIDEYRAEGALIILAHPHWQKEDYWPMDYLQDLDGYTGIEILNSSIRTLTAKYSGERDFWDIATDVWDRLLSAGRRVWGFGNDDFHSRKEFNKSGNYVRAGSLQTDDIVRSVKMGSFVVSTGMAPKEIRVDSRSVTLSVDAPGERKAFFAMGRDGRILATGVTKEDAFTYRPDGGEGYVRFHVLSDSGKALFTQPFFLSPA